MENCPDFCDYGYLYDHNQPQRGSTDETLDHGSVLEGWNSYENFHLGLDSPDANGFQSNSVFGPANGSAPPSSTTTNFTSYQPTFQAAFGDAESDYSSSAWTLTSHEAIETLDWTETPDWPLTSDVIAMRTNFHEGTNNTVRIAQSSSTTTFAPSYHVQPTPISSPSPTTFHIMGDELLGPPQQGFEPFPAGETENPINSACLSSGEIGLQQSSRTRPSHSRRTKPKQPVLELYCDIRPCNYQKAFARKADLERHLVTQHQQPSTKRLSSCPWPNCKYKGAKGFLRRDKMLQHQDRVHGRRVEQGEVILTNRHVS